MGLEKEKKFNSLLTDGIMFTIKGKFDNAEKALNQALNVNDADYRVYVNLSMIYSTKGNVTGAIDILQKGLTKIEHSDLYEQLSVHYETLGNHKESIINISKALKLNDSIDSYFRLFRLHYKLGNHNYCINSLNKILEKDPKNVQAHSNMGNLLFEIGQGEKAIKFLERAVELDPHYNTYEKLAYAYTKNSEFDKALGSFSKSIELGHPNPEIIEDDVNDIKNHLNSI